jgi:hypothetical protein
MTTTPDDFDPDDSALPIPGMEARVGEGGNEKAARRTIAALVADQEVGEKQSVMCEALLTAARQLDRASSNTRAKDYGVAELIGQLREVYKVLAPDREEGGEPDAWTQFLDDLAASGSGAPVRDTAE